MAKQNGKLENKVALITGASRGIGRATAILFAKEGAKVVINYKSNQREAEKVLEIAGKNNGIIARADVSNEEDVKRLVDETVKQFGKIDILVNNAGIVFEIPLMEKTVEQWEQTLRTNLIGTFLCSKYVALYMKQQKGGAIVNVSSTNAFDGYPESIDYDVSKAGITILTKDFAKELAPYVRVNAVAPSWVDTDMNKNLPAGFLKSETEKILLKRFAKPEEIAKAILFLSSDDASFINGSTLTIDGGY